MKLSILDQAPISTGKTAKEALEASAKLAQAAEKFGYTRYWVAEHHDLDGLANPNPSVMLSYIGARTKEIRLGSGAVLLPHYRPYQIAETYNLLATLFPDRIDLGIGRAPGGSAEAAIALSGNFLEKVRNYPELIDELIKFLYQSFPIENMYSKISPSPVPKRPPQPWLLGTSEKSAVLAASKGMPYTFGHFMSNQVGPSIITSYEKSFIPNHPASKPKTIVAISVICAETSEEAHDLALSSQLWKVLQAKGIKENGVPSIEEAKAYPFSNEELQMIEKEKRHAIIGNPAEVKEQLYELQHLYKTNEFMIVTITHSYEARKRSYELIAKEVLN